MSRLSTSVRQDLPKRVMRDSVHLYHQTLDFEVPLLFWRLRAKVSDGEVCRSQVYTIPTEPAIRWQFVINKEHAASREGDFKAYFIRAEESHVGKVMASGKLSVLFETEKLVRTVEFCGVFKNLSTVGSVRISLNAATFKDSLEKDSFTLRCELEVLQSHCHANVKKETRDESFLRTLDNVWKVIDKDDVITVKLDDGECTAHRSILSARSPVFAAMFQNNTKEKQTNSVTIQELERSVIRLMMQYMYTNQIEEKEWNEENASKLLIEADKYMLNGLKDKCEDFLIEQLSSENCTQLLKLGTVCSAKRLQCEALHYVSSKFHQRISVPTLQKKLSDHNFIQWIVNIASELETSSQESEDSFEEESD